MNKNILFVFPLFAVLAGCAATHAPGPPSPVSCEPYAEAKCDGDKTHPIVEIDLDARTITPECIEAQRGRTIIFELVSASPITKDTVEIIPKDSVDDWWLAGSNSPNKKRILVLAPKKKEDGTNFPTGIRQFKVSMPTWCIDPRVRVQP